METLLEDDTQANKLVTYWVAVKRACNRLDKRRQWVDDTNLAGSTGEETRQPKVAKPPKQSNPEEKKIDGDIIEELGKKFEMVTLANMNRRGPKGNEPFRCVWCDSMDHMRMDCASLRDAVVKIRHCVRIVRRNHRGSGREGFSAHTCNTSKI